MGSGLGLRHSWLCLNALEQVSVRVVDELLVCLRVRARFLERHVSGLWIVRGHHRTPAPEGRLLEQGEVLAGLVDTGSDQNRIAALTG